MVDKGSEFCNRSMESFLQNNDIEMYSVHNEGKSVKAERFIRNLKNKVYMVSISTNVYIDKLDDIINKYNNTYHSTIKNKTCWCKIEKEINNKYLKYLILELPRSS